MMKPDNPDADDEEPKPEPSLEQIEERILCIVQEDQAAGRKHTYIFDSWMHASATEFFEYAFNNFGHPDFAIECQAEDATILNRFKQVNEIAEELDETQQKTISDDKEKFEETKEALKSFCEQIQDLVERQNRSTTDVDNQVKAKTKPDRITI